MGRELPGLREPRRQYRQRADDQRRPVALGPLFLQPREERERLERFSQPHLVREDRRDAAVVALPEPPQTLELVRPHRRVDVRRRRREGRGRLLGLGGLGRGLAPAEARAERFEDRLVLEEEPRAVGLRRVDAALGLRPALGARGLAGRRRGARFLRRRVVVVVVADRRALLLGRRRLRRRAEARGHVFVAQFLVPDGPLAALQIVQVRLEHEVAADPDARRRRRAAGAARRLRLSRGPPRLLRDGGAVRARNAVLGGLGALEPRRTAVLPRDLDRVVARVHGHDLARPEARAVAREFLLQRVADSDVSGQRVHLSACGWRVLRATIFFGKKRGDCTPGRRAEPQRVFGQPGAAALWI
mmetsp:Transcript_15157/g.46868  ORF Transcript_15157/g.46868 Transcript_15157/m.46868 type:complete len:358 (-) Transcript_15157:41-1114(-)